MALQIVPGYDAWCGVAHGCTRKLGMKICGKCALYDIYIFSFPLLLIELCRIINCEGDIRRVGRRRRGEGG